MAPKKGKGKKPVAPFRPLPPVAPAVGRSITLNLECLGKLSPALATVFNECGRTTAWPTYHFPTVRIITEVHYFADALWAGLVPPFSDFFNAVLTHYQIHMMHLGPESIALRSVFAFVCEALMGIPPSVALLRHFFSLCLADHAQCSACVSFVAAPETAASGIDFKLPTPSSGFRERWLYVDVGVPGPLLVKPTLPAVPNSGWGKETLESPRLAFVWRRFTFLKTLGVTAPKVVKEFLLRRIAPLQRYSRRMWAFSGHGDHMRLQEEDLTPGVLRTVLLVLTGDPNPGSIQQGGALLFLCQNRDDFVRQMPPFDEWGLRPTDFQGPRENPVVVTALPVGQGESSSSGGAGRHETAEAERAPDEVTAPGDALEGAAPETRAAEAEGGKQSLPAPGAEAPEAPAASSGEAIDSARQAGAPDADRFDAPSSSQVDPCALLLGRFCVDFEALRRKREALGDDFSCRLLKRRKYFAT